MKCVVSTKQFKQKVENGGNSEGCIKKAKLERNCIVKGKLVLKEHEAARWLNKKSIDDVEWLPADITLIKKVRERL